MESQEAVDEVFAKEGSIGDSNDTVESNSNSLDGSVSTPEAALDESLDAPSASDAPKRAFVGSFRGRGRGRRRARWSISKKAGSLPKKIKKSDPDLDDEATDIEDTSIDDEESFDWPTELAVRDRPMPVISEKHRLLIQGFKEKDIISSDSVYQVMMSLDFDHFYKNVKECWVEHNAIILERTLQVIKPGDRVLVLPANLYFSVCLALFVGEKGGVVCYGHLNNTYTIRKCGLDWLMEDYRIRFTNMSRELYFGLDYKDEYLVFGFPKGKPYDALVMTDAPLTPELIDQLKPSGIAFRPDLTVHEMFLRGEVPHQLLEPTESEVGVENVSSENVNQMADPATLSQEID